MNPEDTNVEAQRDDPRSMLTLVRDLLTQRRLLGGGLQLLDAAPGVLAYARGDHAVAINTTGEERPAPVGAVNCDAPVKELIAGGTVCAAVVDVSEIANTKSFQAKMKTRIAAVNTPGAASGMITFVNA